MEPSSKAKKFILSLFFWIITLAIANANNVTISNVSSVIAGPSTQIKFDLSWENSWRTSSPPANYDAVWVFIKYKDASGIWQHLDLTGSDNSISTGFAITVPGDGKGAFIYRDTDGSGNVSLTNVRLGVTNIQGVFDVKVFGIEMVYVPEGNFYAGDGNGSTESIAAIHTGTDINPLSFQITNNLTSGITCNNLFDDGQLNSSGIGIDGDNGLDINNDGTIDNPDFPTGFMAFFVMKYEISQRGYIDFLHTLTYTQQVFNTNFAPNGAPGLNALGVGDIEINISGVSNTVPAQYGVDDNGNNNRDEANDGEWVAAYGLDWPKQCAYLDWAALRPMTELEFEKTCRGPEIPVLNEFAWGTATIFQAGLYTVANLSATNEVVTNASTTEGNGVFGTNRPSLSNPRLRSGVFATATNNRMTSGAGYYGAMEMSGNVVERQVTLGTTAGRSFTGLLGNGNLNASGHADVDFWPGINGNSDGNVINSIYGGTNGVTQAAGSGLKGGDIAETITRLMTSNRNFAPFHSLAMLDTGGGRGVRQVNASEFE